MKSFKVYLFRHGESTYNKAAKFTGWHNPPLTHKGVKQAKTIANSLKSKQFEFAFYTRLNRSQQTLKEVLKFHQNVKTIKDDRMIERNYGALNGHTHDDFINKIGKKLLQLDVYGDAIENLSQKDRKKAEKFLGEVEYKLIHRGYDIRPPKGESFADVEKRVHSFIEFLKKFIKKNKVNVAISAHGNSIRLFRKIMEKAPKEHVIKWHIPYDKVFTYTIKA